jgi:signal transduction histidine kinase
MRGRLTAVVAVLLAVSLLVMLVPVVVLARREAQHRALLAAVRRAELVVPEATGLSAGALPTAPMADGLAVTVYRPDGRVLGVPAALDPAVLARVRQGQPIVGLADRVDVLLPATSPDEGVPAVVRVAMPDEVWRRDVWAAVLPAVFLALALLAVGTLVAGLLARRQLAALRALARGAERIADGDLTARIRPGGPPEIARLGLALNRMAARVGQLIDEQRIRVADLAHQLRTPLTALRLGIDALGASGNRPAAARLGADLLALSRAVDQVIRSMRRGEADQPAESDLVAAVGERVRFWSALADDTGRAVRVVAPERPVPVRVTESDLRAVLDALLGNVFGHTPDGTPMWVRVRPTPGGGGMLVVDDAGPGFSPGPMPALARPGSTGLGLDIARRVAEASGGGIRLTRAPAGGARVEVRFGAPDPVEAAEAGKPA